MFLKVETRPCPRGLAGMAGGAAVEAAEETGKRLQQEEGQLIAAGA